MELPEVTTLEEAKSVIWDLAEEIEKLSNELSWFKRQMFGSKSEHYLPTDDTPSLFPEENLPEPIKESPNITVAEHDRHARQPNALAEIPADLPREERIIDVPETEREGLKFIGYAESERIAYRTGLYVIHFKRAKYAAPDAPLRGVVTAPAPGDVFDSASGRSRYDVSFVARWWPTRSKTRFRLNGRRGCSATRGCLWHHRRSRTFTNALPMLCRRYMTG